MSKILTGTLTFALLTSTAMAQIAPDGPAASESVKTDAGPSVSVTETQRSLDSRGVATEHVQTIDRTQSFSSGDGALSAKTTTESSEHSTVTAPTTIIQRRTTATTTETTR